jgi:hypothetical protein
LRRRVKVDGDLPLGDDFGRFILSLLDDSAAARR